ncbi:hypothetical protein CSX04_00796 [Burkholderia cepacia]|nr:hypothetical protein CSX04_00796 [Burkholderia cepacia]
MRGESGKPGRHAKRYPAAGFFALATPDWQARKSHPWSKSNLPHRDSRKTGNPSFNLLRIDETCPNTDIINKFICHSSNIYFSIKCLDFTTKIIMIGFREFDR